MESNVNREIRNYHEGVFMGLSARQAGCGLLAAGLAAGTNFGLQPFLGTEIASIVCIVAAAIPAAIGFVSFHGQPFEKFAISWLRTMFVHNGWYVYKSSNFYAQFTPEAQLKTNKRKKQTKQKGNDEVNQNEQNEAA